MAWDGGRSCYIAGDSENPQVNREFREIFSDEIAQEGRSKELGFFKLYYLPDEWRVRAEEIFGRFKERDVPRRVYWSITSGSSEDHRQSLPGGLELRQIDAELLESGLVNVDSVKDEILGGWSSLETFLERGFGFTLLSESSVICWCTAEYVSEGKCGIGIETIEEYEGKGFATTVASEFVKHSLSLGVEPYWDCWLSNKASIRVAEKVGFEKAYGYNVAIGTFGNE